MVADVVPVVQTGNNVVSWMEETTQLQGTSAQVSISEGDNAKWQNTLAFTERTSVVETVGTWLAVTNQQLDDVPGIQSIINNRMIDFLRRAEEDLLLNGTGSTPQIDGFLHKSGVNAFARTTETNIDAIWQGIQACRITGFAEPDAIIMHPTNFTPIRLYKATTGDYSFDVTTDSGGVTRLFGKPLILTTAMTLNSALVGGFRTYSAIWRKMGLTVQVGLNSDDFTKNKKTILAEYRETLAIYRAAAFTKVTALQ
jgi:HK97 family phage major capsid protein